jgi:Asp-tRNA(Asn)/Glu-tRNA(Gln) amidotransferase A subunit family amidase
MTNRSNPAPTIRRSPLRARLCTSLAVLLALVGCASTPNRPADLTTLTTREAARLLHERVITSTELTRACLDKARANPELNAFITLDEVGAMEQARRADVALAAGTAVGPLVGVPIVVKDNIQVAGLPASAGTPALANFRPTNDAPVVATLRASGAVILGKTNMHELAFGISGYNEAFHGATIGVRNAYDHSRMAGGSSSGTGAAIAARIASAGLGTDTGGSSRIPAALNGIAGFRPTVGRYSAEGIAPISHTRDTPGPMARTVADVALLDAVIKGERPVVAVDLHGVRLGVERSYFFLHLDADTDKVMADTLAKLTAAGAILVPVEMPGLADANGKVGFPVALYEAYDDMRTYLARYDPGLSVESMAAQIASADVRGTYAGLVIPRKLPTAGGLIDGKPVYDAAISTNRPALQELYANTFSHNKIDALIFPTVPHIAIAQGPAASSLENFGLFIQNTDPGSNAGLPGLSIPAALGASGLPVGVEIDGPAWSDRNLLAIGIAIENLLGPLPPPR